LSSLDNLGHGGSGGWRDVARHLIRASSLPGVLQNDAAPVIVDHPPFFDLVQGSKAAKANQVIVQAAITYARRVQGTVDVTHDKAQL
jgi:hypothetical protein